MHPYVCYVGIATLDPFMVNETIILERNGATITCEALGYPPPIIVWSRLDGILSDRVSLSDSVSVPTGYGNVTRVSVNLTITNASREDTGEYMCSANNSIGSEENNVSITVQCKFLCLTQFYSIFSCHNVYNWINASSKLLCYH